MYRYLYEHPEIHLSKTKELNFFRSAIYDWKDEKKTRNRVRHSFLEICGNNEILRSIVLKKYFQICERKPGFVSGDCSVNYFYEKGMARRIHSYLPDTKLIVMLRNPVDRIYSNFWMNVRQGIPQYQGESFEEFIDKGRWRSPINQYAENLQEWLKYFPKEQILLIKSEDFLEYPQEVLNLLFDFLGVRRHIFPHRIQETPFADKAGQYPPMQDYTRKRLTNLFSYQQYHLLELTGKDFGWFSSCIQHTR